MLLQMLRNPCVTSEVAVPAEAVWKCTREEKCACRRETRVAVRVSVCRRSAVAAGVGWS